MATSTRIYGQALYLNIGGQDYAADMSEAVLSFEEKDTDDMTFGDVAEGGSPDKGKLKIKGIQSMATTSFWRKVWDAAGSTVAFTLAPFGNATPSTTQPHIMGKCVISTRPDIGGAVGPKKSYSFEVEWDCPEVAKELKTAE